MFRTLLFCSVVLAVPCAGHAQTATIPPPFDTKRFEATAQGQSGKVCVGPGYKLIGGGASVDGAGNLVSSFPDFPGRRSNNCWLATALGGGSLKVWAVGVRDTGSQWDVFIDQNAVDRRAATYPKVTISLPPGYALTGGGVQIEKTTTGGLAGSYPTSIRSWEAIGAGLSSQAIITSYIIGIKPTGGGSLNARIKPGTGSSAAVPDTGFTLTGGGARISAGNSLLKSLRPDGTGWSASANSGTSIVTHAVAIQSYPAPSAATPSFDTSWDTLLTTYWKTEKDEAEEEERKHPNDPTKKYSNCSLASQSPIALSSTALTTAPAPSTLTFTNYNTASGTAQAENTGHSYQIWLDPSDYKTGTDRKAPGTCSAPTMSKGDVSVKFEGDTTSYKLNSYHFHHPSEHVLDGVRYPLEMHIVHQNTADNTKKLVLGVFLTPVAAGETPDTDFAPWEGAGKHGKVQARM
jgi:hypothetical protein